MTPESENPYAVRSALSSAPAKVTPLHLGLAAGWALLVATAGGAAFGWLSDRFGTVAAVSLWALGALAGFGSRKITRDPSAIAAWFQGA